MADKRGLSLCERQTFRVRSTVGDALIRSADERPGIRNECNLPKANPVRFRNGSDSPLEAFSSDAHSRIALRAIVCSANRAAHPPLRRIRAAPTERIPRKPKKIPSERRNADKRGLFLCERQTFRVRSTVGDALIRSADERPGIRNECNLPKANPVRFRNGSDSPLEAFSSDAHSRIALRAIVCSANRAAHPPLRRIYP